MQIGEQKLYHFDGDDLEKAYTISTSLKEPSCQENSQGTPTGLHEIADKIGDGAEPGTVFVGRKPMDWVWEYTPPNFLGKNLVTSRIMRLRGLEPGHNAGPGCDSYDRFIYIHGTNHPKQLGRPQTAGCPVLSDADVIELFDKVPEGSLVWVEE